MALNVLLCVVGFLLLYYGAGWLVRGSSSLARSFGISPLVIGLTVVAFGTSAPELVVSLVSSLKGESMIAVGNVVGSNICNIALVLGLAAVFQPIVCKRSVFRRDIPIMLGISALLLLLCLDSYLGRIEGAGLVAGIVVYTGMNYAWSRRETGERRDGVSEEHEADPGGRVAVTSRPLQVFLIVTGIAGVAGGAELVVSSAKEIMLALEVSPKFIGLTVVALGTSLPELATSVVAALRKEMDISLGNLVGSNVFNLMSVLGVAALVRPISIPGGLVESGLVVDFGVMIFVSALPWLLMVRDSTVSRRGGILLLAFYAAYLAYLVSQAG